MRYSNSDLKKAFRFSSVYQFFYNHLSKKWAPSTKKSVLQIAGALFITVLTLLIVAILESTFKVPQETEKVSAIKTQSEATQNQSQDRVAGSQTAGLNNSKDEQARNSSCNYSVEIICIIADSRLLGQVQNIGVIAASVLFFIDVFDRKKQIERQAWQLIDGALGSETSGARRQAILDLYEENANITGLDADGADLRGIKLRNANLYRASFKKADLEQADFTGANLEEANFTGANLKGATFIGAKLWGANFTGADLSTPCQEPNDKQIVNEISLNDTKSGEGADLRNAKLGRAIFNYANLCNATFGKQKASEFVETNLNGAKFKHANLKNVNLNGVDISKTEFGGAIDLTKEIIQETINYENAKFGQDFCAAHPELNLKEDIVGLEGNFAQTKIYEVIQRVKNKIQSQHKGKESLSDIIQLLEILIEEFNQEHYSSNQDIEIVNKVADIRDGLINLDLVTQEGEKLLQENTLQEIERKESILNAKNEALYEEIRSMKEDLEQSKNKKNNI